MNIIITEMNFIKVTYDARAQLCHWVELVYNGHPWELQK